MTRLEQVLFKNLKLAVEKLEWDSDKALHGCTDAYCQECDKGRSEQVWRFNTVALPEIREILSNVSVRKHLIAMTAMTKAE